METHGYWPEFMSQTILGCVIKNYFANWAQLHGVGCRAVRCYVT